MVHIAEKDTSLVIVVHYPVKIFLEINIELVNDDIRMYTSNKIN